MIDYMHPMVLLNEQILSDINEKARLGRDIKENEEKLKKLFEDTLLYKELKEQYLDVKLKYMDEDIMTVKVKFNDNNMRLDCETLIFNTQEIDDKLQ